MSNNQFQEMYGEYLRDESRQTGFAESISFPRTEDEIINIIKENAAVGVLVTTQGSRTGLAASCVPYGGHILNLSRMNKVIGARYDVLNDRFYLKTEPGVLLSEVRNYLGNKSFDISNWDRESIQALNFMKPGEWFYSTDPTETSASIGGMAACNASGARSFKYGSARDHITGLRVILADGDILEIKRGQYYADNYKFSLLTEGDRQITGILPSYNIPAVKKNTAGYYTKKNMDMIDLFIGSDGTLGVFSEIEIELTRTLPIQWGLIVFMPDEKKALNLVISLREEKTLKPSAIELYSHTALDMLREQQKSNSAFSSIQEIKESFHTGIYIEIESDSEEEIFNAVEEILNKVELLGGSDDSVWVADDPNKLDKLHSFRHACPECVNMQIDIIKRSEPSITKLGSDMSVPDSKLIEVMNMYNEDIAKNNLHAVIFGHIGNNHLHVNIIPRNINEFNTGKELFSFWAEKIALMGGTVSAEHGVGKLKSPFLQKMYSEDEINSMRELKIIFDPEQILNRGNIFHYSPKKL